MRRSDLAIRLPLASALLLGITALRPFFERIPAVQAHVIGILLTVVRSHPEVLPNPEPGAFFTAFGPSSMDFLLMFWAEQQTHFRLRSEIAIAVYTALNQAGIEIPLPQQEVRMRAADPAAFSQAAGAPTA